MVESRDQRIATLAATLKTSGIAKSDAQARMMAEEMIGVEEHVQKSYEEEHAKATEYLKSAKNLGRPVVRPGQEAQKPQISPINTSKQQVSDPQTQVRKIEPVYTDVAIGKKSLAEEFDSHDTHNPALEAIKQAAANTHITPLEDMDPNAVHGKISKVPASDSNTLLSTTANVKSEAQQVQLDTSKLVEMMEEDGKLEEHTREIKETPKDVKPKEEYEENNIDLSSMFNVNKK